RENLRKLRDLAYFISEVANQVPNDRQPFVGRSVFAHKGGVHADAVMKHPETYEHIDPALVGNERRILVSELSGGASIVAKAREFGIELEKGSSVTKRILSEIKALENEGYDFEGADASFELLVRKHLGQRRSLFRVESFRVIVEGRNGDIWAEATVKLGVGNSVIHTAAEGDGPVHALDLALRKALEQFYPDVKHIRLIDYKVRVVNSAAATAAKVRVLIESADEQTSWCTLGVSTNIIEASLEALVDSIEYGLLRRNAQPTVSQPEYAVIS
ncbi:MAG TPA: citramalate synthase, partial [Armatimonadetes bacterium]|nr:citramalate synthase [Armatimonadota bacterium]